MDADISFENVKENHNSRDIGLEGKMLKWILKK
jgi:hypothetical protein